MLGTNPLIVLVWFLFILSISFFATNVGTLIALAVPTQGAETVKTILQIIFMYFGLGPAVIVVFVGFFIGQLALCLAIGTILNAIVGYLVSLLLPLFLGRK
jgi:hypothetical protein